MLAISRLATVLSYLHDCASAVTGTVLSWPWCFGENQSKWRVLYFPGFTFLTLKVLLGAQSNIGLGLSVLLADTTPLITVKYSDIHSNFEVGRLVV